MDIGSAFTYVFDDEDWIKKVAIGGGVTILAFVLSFVLIGVALFSHRMTALQTGGLHDVVSSAFEKKNNVQDEGKHVLCRILYH